MAQKLAALTLVRKRFYQIKRLVYSKLRLVLGKTFEEGDKAVFAEKKINDLYIHFI